MNYTVNITLKHFSSRKAVFWMVCTGNTSTTTAPSRATFVQEAKKWLDHVHWHRPIGTFCTKTECSDCPDSGRSGSRTIRAQFIRIFRTSSSRVMPLIPRPLRICRSSDRRPKSGLNQRRKH